MVTAQEKVFKKSFEKQNTIQKIHHRGWIPKNHIVAVVRPVFLSTLVDQLTGCVQVYAIVLLQYLCTSYEAIN